MCRPRSGAQETATIRSNAGGAGSGEVGPAGPDATGGAGSAAGSAGADSRAAGRGAGSGAPSVAADDPHWLRLLSFTVSAGGYSLFAFVVVWLIFAGRFVPGGGDVKDVYHAAGDALWNGRAVYTYTYPPYFYSPPWTVVLAALSRLPLVAEWTLINALNVAALRYVAGSWRRVGYMLWIIPIAWELALGNINLLIAASIVAAVRDGNTFLPAALSFAKFSPVLAVDPRKWRRFALWIGLGLAITLPWWWLWPDWIAQMTRAWSNPVGWLLPIPFAVRLPVALILVATRTRLGRVTGAILAIPALYYLSTVTLVAPLAICLDLLAERRAKRHIGAGEAAAAQFGDVSGDVHGVAPQPAAGPAPEPAVVPAPEPAAPPA
jgi:hypothetical protein